MLIIGILLAIIPAIVILYFTINKYGPVHLYSFLICLALGMLSTLPAFQVERLEFLFPASTRGEGWSLFFIAFVFVGLGEELIKFLMLFAFAYYFKKIKTIGSGIMYAMVIGMGFALVENVFYAYIYPISTVAVRSFTAVPAHGIFAIITGYFLGMGFSKKQLDFALIFRGLLFATLLHGIYDWLILQHYAEWLTGVAIAVLALGIFYSILLIKKADLIEKIENSEIQKKE